MSPCLHVSMSPCFHVLRVFVSMFPCLHVLVYVSCPRPCFHVLVSVLCFHVLAHVNVHVLFRKKFRLPQNSRNPLPLPRKTELTANLRLLQTENGNGSLFSLVGKR
jgi:hypothetical protein